MSWFTNAINKLVQSKLVLTEPEKRMFEFQSDIVEGIYNELGGTVTDQLNMLVHFDRWLTAYLNTHIGKFLNTSFIAAMLIPAIWVAVKYQKEGKWLTLKIDPSLLTGIKLKLLEEAYLIDLNYALYVKDADIIHLLSQLCDKSDIRELYDLMFVYQPLHGLSDSFRLAFDNLYSEELGFIPTTPYKLFLEDFTQSILPMVANENEDMKKRNAEIYKFVVEMEEKEIQSVFYLPYLFKLISRLPEKDRLSVINDLELIPRVQYGYYKNLAFMLNIMPARTWNAVLYLSDKRKLNLLQMIHNKRELRHFLQALNTKEDKLLFVAQLPKEFLQKIFGEKYKETAISACMNLIDTSYASNPKELLNELRLKLMLASTTQALEFSAEFKAQFNALLSLQSLPPLPDRMEHAYLDKFTEEGVGFLSNPLTKVQSKQKWLIEFVDIMRRNLIKPATCFPHFIRLFSLLPGEAARRSLLENRNVTAMIRDGVTTKGLPLLLNMLPQADWPRLFSDGIHHLNFHHVMRNRSELRQVLKLLDSDQKRLDFIEALPTDFLRTLVGASPQRSMTECLHAIDPRANPDINKYLLLGMLRSHIGDYENASSTKTMNHHGPLFASLDKNNIGAARALYDTIKSNKHAEEMAPHLQTAIFSNRDLAMLTGKYHAVRESMRAKVIDGTFKPR